MFSMKLRALSENPREIRHHSGRHRRPGATDPANRHVGFSSAQRLHASDRPRRFGVHQSSGANADVIVSRDKHLLKLIDPDTAWAAEFRQQFPGIEVLEPQDFLVPHEKSE
jgi:hypothetical protein